MDLTPAASTPFAYAPSDTVTVNSSSEEEPHADIPTYLKWCQATNAIFITVTLWIILNLVLYLIKHRQRRAIQSPNSLDGRQMYVVCLAAIVCALPRLIMSQVMFYVTAIPGALQNCEILLDVLNAFYLIAVAATYGFLWYRQRIIYGLPMIREMTGIVANILSWVLVLIMLGSYTTLFCVFSIPSIYSWNDAGCTLKANQSRDDKRARASRYYIITGVMVIWQITLVFLFVYPMILIKRSQLTNRNSRKHTSIREGVKRTISRSLICASIAALSDMTTVTIAAFIPIGYPVFIATSLYDLSLQINILCVITTFGDNVGLLAACYYYAEKSMTKKQKRKTVKLKAPQPDDYRPRAAL